MRPMWGWCLPYVDNQRAVGNSLKVVSLFLGHLQIVSKCSAIHDASYYEFITVRGYFDCISTIISQIVLTVILLQSRV